MKRKIIVCALSLGFFFLLASACRQDKGTFQTVSTDEFATAIARPEVQRVDVRTLLEYTEGHIPGSVNLNVLDEENFEACADSLLDKSQLWHSIAAADGAARRQPPC